MEGGEGEDGDGDDADDLYSCDSSDSDKSQPEEGGFIWKRGRRSSGFLQRF